MSLGRAPACGRLGPCRGLSIGGARGGPARGFSVGGLCAGGRSCPESDSAGQALCVSVPFPTAFSLPPCPRVLRLTCVWRWVCILILRSRLKCVVLLQKKFCSESSEAMNRFLNRLKVSRVLFGSITKTCVRRVRPASAGAGVTQAGATPALSHGGSAFQMTAPHYQPNRMRSSGPSFEGFQSLNFGEFIPEGG